MKKLLLIGLLVIGLAPLGISAPWRRTTRGWERATWLDDDSTSKVPAANIRQAEAAHETAPETVWHRLHPAILATLQFGGSFFAMLSLEKSGMRRRAGKVAGTLRVP